MKMLRVYAWFSVMVLLTAFATCSGGGSGGGGGGGGSCTAGQTQPCDNCGTQTCSSSSTWGACTGQGVCSPGQTQSCSGSGTQTCTSSCAWDNCSGLPAASPIAAGGDDTCALASAGGVKCWGDNSYGQLGDGTGNSSYIPVGVSGLASGVNALSTGDYLVFCVITSAGGVKCWGDNSYGELGDGTSVYGSYSEIPVNVSGLSSGVSAVSAGFGHTCALTSSGGAKCWGSNWAGLLGSGGPASISPVPVDVFGLSAGVQSISVSQSHSCAVTSAGGAMCWGDNEGLGLGDGTTAICRFTPVSVSGLSSGVSAISLAYHYTCALTSAGGVKCWGEGPLGNGASSGSNIPVDVSGLTSGVSAISVGGDSYSHHACALTSGGGVKCWGANTYGQLGDGTNTERYIPVNVSGLASGVSAVSAGGNHTCALTSSGSIKCWGANRSGQLGNGTTSGSSIPINTLWP